MDSLKPTDNWTYKHQINISELNAQTIEHFFWPIGLFLSCALKTVFTG